MTCGGEKEGTGKKVLGESVIKVLNCSLEIWEFHKISFDCFQPRIIQYVYKKQVLELRQRINSSGKVVAKI